jgi:L-ascorbate metabolism protein UlaG (beta-lactamase superfamily)
MPKKLPRFTRLCLKRVIQGPSPEYPYVPRRAVEPSLVGRRSTSQGAGPARITFLGHSTVLVEMDGIRVLTDPILRRQVGPLKRAVRAPREEHWSNIDAVLISHTHWDHLDFGSLDTIGRETPLLVPPGLTSQARGRGFANTVELEPGETHDIGELRVRATVAKHKGFGPPLGATARCIGFLLDGSQRVYFAGDTSYFEEMAEFNIGIDLALIPVWGWGPTAKPSEHLDPMGAAQATALIRPRFAVPIHWGSLHPIGLRRLFPSTRVDPPHNYAQLVRAYAADTTVRVLPVGATLTLEP